MSEYPEHERLRRIQPLSQAIYDFLEWSSEKGYILGEWIGDTLFPAGIDRREMIAEFFEIDLKKLEEEKRDMLSNLLKD
ncbi:MAG: hypothetical protein D6698_07410 [Gammaproteobacteria bacterium]|nr:MAG: hypothetical protein D6698_07410 [Gammaproteobacteria bacterium]